MQGGLELAFFAWGWASGFENPLRSIYPPLKRKNFLAKPPHYASNYVLYIEPYVALKIMSDTLVNRLVDLEPGLKSVTSLGRGKPRAHGYRPFAGYLTGQWLLGRNTGPRPEAFSSLP